MKGYFYISGMDYIWHHIVCTILATHMGCARLAGSGAAGSAQGVPQTGPCHWMRLCFSLGHSCNCVQQIMEDSDYNISDGCMRAVLDSLLQKTYWILSRFVLRYFTERVF